MLRTNTPLLCFSHLRWDFVFQRPQHVMSRFARRRPVFFWEEPYRGAIQPQLERRTDGGVVVLTPHLPADMDERDANDAVRALLDAFVAELGEPEVTLWYYTPMALDFSRHLSGERVYDCMDELSLFKNAPSNLVANERELLGLADVVFTGGRSLYYAKRRAHPNVHCFPSSVEREHFARTGAPDPHAALDIRRPRIGFYGVIDERFDTAYVRELAALLHDWEFVLLGPVVKIDERDLPRAQNIHYLGITPYANLPAYLEHWDVTFLPFALNDATRFISPTKTLEYLAAHKPVISTPIADVVDPYGKDGLVAIAPTPADAAHAARTMRAPTSPAWHDAVDALLDGVSWDRTVDGMMRVMPGERAVEIAG